MPSFGALSPRTVPDDPVPSPHKGSLSQQDCISDSPGDHGQTAGRLGAPGTPQSLHPLPFGPWLLSSPQSQAAGLEPHWWARTLGWDYALGWGVHRDPGPGPSADTCGHCPHWVKH